MRIGRNGFLHLRANEACIRARRNPEGLHQARVALRRLRSVFSAFRGLLPESDRRRIGADLRWIARRLGPARDWDVFAADLLAPIRALLVDDRALKPFADAVLGQRKAAYAEVARTLDGPDYTDILLRLEAWWEGGSWVAAAEPPWSEPARDFAAGASRKLHRKFVRLG